MKTNSSYYSHFSRICFSIVILLPLLTSCFPRTSESFEVDSVEERAPEPEEAAPEPEEEAESDNE